MFESLGFLFLTGPPHTISIIISIKRSCVFDYASFLSRAIRRFSSPWRRSSSRRSPSETFFGFKMNINSSYSFAIEVVRALVNGCRENKCPLSLNYPLNFQAKAFGFSPTVLTTGFPVFLSTSLQFGQVLILVAIERLQKTSNYNLDLYPWGPINKVTTRSRTLLFT